MQKRRRKKGMKCDGLKAAGLRRVLGFSQQDVADKAKVSKTTVESLERGMAVDYQTIHQIAAVLDVAFNDLLQAAERGERQREAKPGRRQTSCHLGCSPRPAS